MTSQNIKPKRLNTKSRTERVITIQQTNTLNKTINTRTLHVDDLPFFEQQLSHIIKVLHSEGHDFKSNRIKHQLK